MQDDETIRFEPAEQLLTHLSSTDLRELSQLLDDGAGRPRSRARPICVRDFLVHHLPYKELAEKYRMPIGSVGVSLARSLDKIRAHLQAMPKLWKELAAYLR